MGNAILVHQMTASGSATIHTLKFTSMDFFSTPITGLTNFILCVCVPFMYEKQGNYFAGNTTYHEVIAAMPNSSGGAFADMCEISTSYGMSYGFQAADNNYYANRQRPYTSWASTANSISFTRVGTGNSGYTLTAIGIAYAWI